MRRLVLPLAAALALTGGGVLLPALADGPPPPPVYVPPPADQAPDDEIVEEVPVDELPGDGTPKPTSLDGVGLTLLDSSPSDSTVSVAGCGGTHITVTYHLVGPLLGGNFAGTMTEDGTATFDAQPESDLGPGTYSYKARHTTEGMPVGLNGHGADAVTSASSSTQAAATSTFTMDGPQGHVVGTRSISGATVDCSISDYTFVIASAAVNYTERETSVCRTCIGINVRGASTWSGVLTDTAGKRSALAGTSPFNLSYSDSHNEGTMSTTSDTSAPTTTVFDLSKYLLYMSTRFVQVSATPATNSAPTVTVAGIDKATYELGTPEPTVTCDATDAEDGPSHPTPVMTSALDETGRGTKTFTCTATDSGGLSSASVSRSYQLVDTTPPAVPAFVGGPADGSSAVYGHTPAAPTCTSSDSGTGLASCVVTGYSTDVGVRTLTATATDRAGLSSTSTRTYTVLPYSLRGFFAPVDSAAAVNTVKAGSTVPLKFRVFDGTTELTSVAAVASFDAAKVPCSGGAGQGPLTTTGGTALRYDVSGGQFVQNWKTPSTAGTCAAVTMTTVDGSRLKALFSLK